MEENNYSQVTPMSFEERVAMYMQCSKLDLARMLAERDRRDLDFPFLNQRYPFDTQKEWWDYQITCSNAVDESNSTSLKV